MGQGYGPSALVPGSQKSPGSEKTPPRRQPKNSARKCTDLLELRPSKNTVTPLSRWGGIVIARCHQPCSSWAWRWPRMKMLGWEKMIRRIILVGFQLFLNRAHRSSSSNSTSSSTVSYIRVVAIAHAQAPKWFRAQNDGKSQDFFLRNNFPVVSWGFYVHFRKETRIFIKMWLSTSTSFLGVPCIRISSNKSQLKGGFTFSR